MVRRTEYALLAGLVLLAATLRLVWLDPAHSPSFHPALGSVLFIDELLRSSGLRGAWHHWTTLFRSLQGLSLVDRSVVAFPPAVLAQMALGPSFVLPAYVGAMHGVAAVVLAWAAARLSGGPALGLTFAGLLAVSPVEIVWSRIGGLYVASVPHLLLGILCAQLAARRNSALLAALAGTVAWLGLYNYYATRIGIAVATGILVASDVGAGRRAWLVGWFLAPLLAGYLAFGSDGLVQTLWPAAGGGFVPPAERSVANMVALAWERWRLHWVPSLALVFTAGRTTPPAPWGWGFDSGGMLPLPVLLLGAAGSVMALFAPRRHVAWLLLAVLGYAITALSGAEVRRLLPFDVAWNYFAALAVVDLVRSRALAAVPRSVLGAALLAGVVATGVWSLLAIASLTQRSTLEVAPIPFGYGALGEAVMCPSCDALALHWRDWIRSGNGVVLFDPDRARDKRIFRLGLRGYGMLGALEAGRPAHFMTACGDWQWRPASHPSRVECRSDPQRLRAHLASLDPPPPAVRFHFTTPAADAALVRALGQLGTVTRPLPALRHLEITIDPARLPQALDAIERAQGVVRESARVPAPRPGRRLPQARTPG